MRCPLEEESFYREYSQWARWSWLVFSIPSPLPKTTRFPKMIIHHSSPLSIRGQRRRWQTQVSRQWGGQFFFTPDHFGIIGFTIIIIVNTLCSVQTVLKCAFFWIGYILGFDLVVFHHYLWRKNIQMMWAIFRQNYFFWPTLTCVCLSKPLVANHSPHGT